MVENCLFDLGICGVISEQFLVLYLSRLINVSIFHVILSLTPKLPLV